MKHAMLAVAFILLAGCGAPEAPEKTHRADKVIAGADFPPPVTRAQVEAAAAELGWGEGREEQRVPEGFSLLWEVEGRSTVVQAHPARENWSLTRFYDIEGNASGPHATREAAGAAANAAWPTFEAEFEAFVRKFEEAGGWERVRIRHSCLCSES